MALYVCFYEYMCGGGFSPQMIGRSRLNPTKNRSNDNAFHVSSTDVVTVKDLRE